MCYILRDLSSLSYPTIGDVLKKHHTSALYAHKRALARYRDEDGFRAKVDSLKTRLSAA
jgi:chromosomal replication initiation ATPase DnaA